jgi:hypothetical protein
VSERAQKRRSMGENRRGKEKKGTTTKAWRLDARGKIDIGIAS